MLTTYLITDRRIVSVTYNTLTKRETEEIALKDITNVREKFTGISSHLFKFATVELEGAGSPIIFKNISQPAEVKQIIGKLKHHDQ